MTIYYLLSNRFGKSDAFEYNNLKGIKKVLFVSSKYYFGVGSKN